MLLDEFEMLCYYYHKIDTNQLTRIKMTEKEREYRE